MGAFCSKCEKSKPKKQATQTEKEIQEKGVESSSSVNKIDSNTEIQRNINSNETFDAYFNKEELKVIQRTLQEEKESVVEKRQILNYKKGSLIGEGSYGKVYQGFDEDLGQIIAIKEIDLRRITNNNYLEAKISSFQSEIDILSQLNHKNIVKYYGTKRTSLSFHIFLEFCIGGSIAKMLEVYKYFSENVIRKYTRQVLEGLEYLHSHNVIHRDIKGANILVERDGLCKLSDFGGAKVIKDEIEFKQQNSFKGTPNWMAPETVRNLEYTRFSDIWSIGCLVIEMATGEPPWAEYKNPMAALYNLMHTNTPPEFPPHLSDNCKHFLSCCLKINPRERLNVCKLLKHPFITNENIIPNAEIHSGNNTGNAKKNKSREEGRNTAEIKTKYMVNTSKDYASDIKDTKEIKDIKIVTEFSKSSSNLEKDNIETNIDSNKHLASPSVDTKDIKIETHDLSKPTQERKVTIRIPKKRK